MLTPRLERLKNQIVQAKPEVYAERALLVTQAYRETENDPPEIQKARAMEKIFRQSTVVIKDDELIVGCKTPTALGSPLYPEFNVDWIKKEIDGLSQRYEIAFDISEDNKKAIKEKVIPYWEGRTLYDHILPTITKVEAQELLSCLWVKFAEMTVVKEAGTAKASNTYADFQNLNVGGLKADGSDGVNDISYMCIEAQSALLLPQPQQSCLISSKSPHAFLLKACELARKGTGMPAMFNADGIVLSLAEKGKSLKDARNGGINGCVEITGQGNDQMASSGYINLAKCLELALNNGINVVSGKQLGPKTGMPDQFRSIDDVWQALEAQIRHMVDLKHQFDTATKRVFAQSCPALCTSLVVDDCIKKGKDFHNGGARYSQPMLSGVGTGTVTDAIAAIDHFVFGKGTFTTDEIVQAMKDNFKGHETMRNLLWNKALKLGNDRDEVDRIAARLVSLFVKLLKDYTNDRGVPYGADMIPTTAHLPFGVLTAASADGRLAGAPLAEGISPVQGQDLSGPTAVVKSMAKLDHASTVGSLLNMKFTPQTLAGEENLKKFAALIRTYFDMGGHHMQFNVVSREILLEAQQYPDD